MDKVISLVDRVPYCFLHPFRLQPWLAVGRVYVRVGTEEGVPSAQLVKLNKQVVSDITVEPRDVRSSKRMA